MSSIISGIDLTKVAEYREKVTVTLNEEGDTLTLPLIELRDAQIAELFVAQLDSIKSEWAAITALYDERALEEQRLKQKAEKSTDLTNEEFIKGIKNIAANAMEAQGEHQELLRKIRKVTDKIHEFLTPYLEGTNVIDILREQDDAVTQKVLFAMLYGKAAFDEDSEEDIEETDEENKDSKKNQ